METQKKAAAFDERGNETIKEPDQRKEIEGHSDGRTKKKKRRRKKVIPKHGGPRSQKLTKWKFLRKEEEKNLAHTSKIFVLTFSDD